MEFITLPYQVSFLLNGTCNRSMKELDFKKGNYKLKIRQGIYFTVK